MIIGRDLIRSLGIDTNGADMPIHCDDATISWRDIYSTTKDVFALSQYNTPFNSETKGMKRILDDKYYKTDLLPWHKAPLILTSNKKNELYTLLKKYECLFDGNLGKWHGKPYGIKLKPDAEPYHRKTFPVTHIFATLKRVKKDLEA